MGVKDRDEKGTGSSLALSVFKEEDGKVSTDLENAVAASGGTRNVEPKPYPHSLE